MWKNPQQSVVCNSRGNKLAFQPKTSTLTSPSQENVIEPGWGGGLVFSVISRCTEQHNISAAADVAVAAQSSKIAPHDR